MPDSSSMWQALDDINRTTSAPNNTLFLVFSSSPKPPVAKFLASFRPVISACNSGTCFTACDACVAQRSVNPRSSFRAVLAVLKYLKVSRIVLIFDKIGHENGWHLEELVVQASEANITQVSFKADLGTASSRQRLRKGLKALVRDFAWKHRHFLVLCEESTTKALLNEAKDVETNSGLLSRKFFWIILSPVQDETSLLQQSPHFINLMLIHRRFSSCQHPGTHTVQQWLQAVHKTASECSLCDPQCQQRILRQTSPCNPASSDVDILATVTDDSDQISTNWALVGKYSPINNSLSPFMSLFPNTFKDFRGQRLRIATVVYRPFIIETYRNFTDGNVTCHIVEGALIDAINIIARHLNFTTCYLYPADGAYGNYDDLSNTATGMLGMAFRKEVSLVAAGLTASFQRAKAVDFSLPFINEASGIIIRKSAAHRSIFAVLEPFHWSVWLALTCVVLAIGLCQWYITRASPFNGVASHQESDKADDLRLKHNLWNAFGSIMDQGQEMSPNSHSARLISIVYWFFCLMLINLYSAKLIMYMTLEDTSLPIENFEDLSNQKNIRALVLADSYLQGYLAKSKFPKDQRVNKLFPQTLPESKDDAMRKVRHSIGGRWAFMGDYKWLLTLEAEDCENLVLLPEVFDAAAFLALAFPKNSFYEEAINLYVQQLTETGFITKAYDRWFERNIGRSCPKISTNSAAGFKMIELKTLLGTWLIFAAFVIIATVIGCGEYWWRCFSDIRLRKIYRITTFRGQEITTSL